MKNFTKFTNLSKVVQKYQMVKIYDVVRLILLCPNFLKCRFIILFIPFFKKIFLLHFLDRNLMSLEVCETLPKNLLSSALFRKNHISKFHQFPRIIILHSALKTKEK